MRVNRPNMAPRTFEGGPALPSSSLDALRRSVLACMLWERSFYESGEDIAARIARLVAQCQPSDVMALAVQARDDMHLRHVPLLLMRELARHPLKPYFADTLAKVIQRADEITEFLSLYWQDGRSPLSKQVKKGLAQAFVKFDAYQLAKYNRDNAIKLRDALFMVHPKPKSAEQEAVWKQLVDGTLAAPDTWEVALSGNQDKAEVFTRLMSEGKLGYMALLRNLRNMAQSGVSADLVREHLLAGAKKSKALPFRYIAAARSVPQWEAMIDEAMLLAMQGMDRLPGKTVVLIDVSGSMEKKLSSKSDLTRMDAACALGILVRGISDDVRLFSFSADVVEVPARQGVALADAIKASQPYHGTYLGQALKRVNDVVPDADRIIVFTDEQSHDTVGGPGNARGYMINVASNQNGVGYGQWERINGFSESVVRYIQAIESTQA